MEPSRKRVANAVATAMDSHSPTVRRHYDETETHAVDILEAHDRPAPGLVSYSTVNLHLAPNLMDGVNVPVELAGVATEANVWFPEALATAGRTAWSGVSMSCTVLT